MEHSATEKVLVVESDDGFRGTIVTLLSKLRQYDTVLVIPIYRLSCLGSVAGVERRTRTLGTAVSPYNGLAKPRRHCLLFALNSLDVQPISSMRGR